MSIVKTICPVFLSTFLLNGYALAEEKGDESSSDQKTTENLEWKKAKKEGEAKRSGEENKAKKAKKEASK